MPKVNVTWNAAWLNLGTKEDAAMRYLLILELCESILPAATADAISLVSGKMMHSGEVDVRGDDFSFVSVNQPELWIDVQWDDHESYPTEQSIRRQLVTAALAVPIIDFYRRYAPFVEPPEIDIECRAIAGSGRTISRTGRLMFQWD